VGSYRQGVAAVLPCYWIYREVGRELARKGSPEPRYQRWIDSYADEAFDTLVREVLAVVDGWTATADEEPGLRVRFQTAARYEWMFWDAAWRSEAWPV
jgi:thiaminase/transcriptional activator TenA